MTSKISLISSMINLRNLVINVADLENTLMNLSLLFYKNIYNLSFRDLRFFMIEIFDHSPAISTIHYRLSKLSISVLEELLNRIVSELVGKEVELSLLDGTTPKGVKWRIAKPNVTIGCNFSPAVIPPARIFQQARHNR